MFVPITQTLATTLVTARNNVRNPLMRGRNPSRKRSGKYQMNLETRSSSIPWSDIDDHKKRSDSSIWAGYANYHINVSKI